MNRTEKYCRTIKFLCNSGDVIKEAWDLQTAYLDIQATVADNAGITNVEGTPQLISTDNVDYGWRGLILADNGCIYSVPNQGTKIHKINAETNAVTTISLGETGLCFRGCFATDRKIYMPPSSSINKLRVLDTTSDSVTSINIGFTGMAGSFCGADGTVFSFPGSGTSWYVYNTKTGAHVTSFNRNFGGNSSRLCVITTPTGLLATSYIDPFNFIVWEEIPTWEQINNPNYTLPYHTITNTRYKYQISGLFAPNGYAYSLPLQESTIAIYDSATSQLTSGPGVISYTCKIGYDNSFYFGRASNSYVYLSKYNIANNKYTDIHTITTTNGLMRITGMALYNNKLFYQSEKGNIYVITLNVNKTFKPATLLSPLINRP